MKAKLEKIRIIGLKKSYQALSAILQKKENLHLIENSEFIKASKAPESDHSQEFELAKLKFAIKTLEPVSEKKPFTENLFTGGKIILNEQ